jgi:hypothetical protein
VKRHHSQVRVQWDNGGGAMTVVRFVKGQQGRSELAGSGRLAPPCAIRPDIVRSGGMLTVARNSCAARICHLPVLAQPTRRAARQNKTSPPIDTGAPAGRLFVICLACSQASIRGLRRRRRQLEGI